MFHFLYNTTAVVSLLLPDITCAFGAFTDVGFEPIIISALDVSLFFSVTSVQNEDTFGFD